MNDSVQIHTHKHTHAVPPRAAAPAPRSDLGVLDMEVMKFVAYCGGVSVKIRVDALESAPSSPAASSTNGAVNTTGGSSTAAHTAAHTDNNSSTNSTTNGTAAQQAAVTPPAKHVLTWGLASKRACPALLQVQQQQVCVVCD